MAPIKTKVAFVRLGPEDHAEITGRARTAGLSVAAYLRKAREKGVDWKEHAKAIYRGEG